MSLISILHKELEKKNEKSKVGRDVCKFYPSSAGKCLRSIVYQMQGYPSSTPDGRALMIFENGNSYHERIEHLFKHTDILIANELSFKVPTLRLSGRSDIVIKNYNEYIPSDNIIKLYAPAKENEEPKLIYEGPDNGVIIIELKSIKESGYNYVVKSGPKKEHILQLQLYLHITGAKIGMLLYENKNTQEMKEYLINYDPIIGQEIMNKIKLANHHVDNNTLPEKEFLRTDFDCLYCSYKELCWPTKNKYSLDDIL